jgi:hypothetical protein
MRHSRSRETAEALFRRTQRPDDAQPDDPKRSDIRRQRDEVQAKTARLKELRLAQEAASDDKFTRRNLY